MHQVLGGSLISDSMGTDVKVVYENLRDVRSARAPLCCPHRFSCRLASPAPVPISVRFHPCRVPAISSSVCFPAIS